MSGFIKLLASMGIPIPRLADWHLVKDGNSYMYNHAVENRNIYSITLKGA